MELVPGLPADVCSAGVFSSSSVRSRKRTRVASSPSGSNSTEPSMRSPLVERQAIPRSWSWSVTSASHSIWRPSTTTTQRMVPSSITRHLPDELQEAGVLVEAVPLLVGLANRHLDVDRLLSLCHCPSVFD
jgi:hypothetical protein